MTDKETIVQDIFRKTNVKITEDDPLIEAIVSFYEILDNTKEDFKEWAGIFASQFEDDLNVLTLKNNTKLEILEHELKDVIKEVSKELETITSKTLSDFDEKTKDLNMILAKLQVSHDRDNTDRFDKHFAKIDERYNQMLEIQRKNKAFSQREILFALGGFVACLVVCLIILLVVR